MSERVELKAATSEALPVPRQLDEASGQAERKDAPGGKDEQPPQESKLRNVRPRRKLTRVLPFLLVALITFFLVSYFFLRRPNTPRSIVAVSGRVEGDDAAIAAKISGRIREITVREGDDVRAGQIVAVLDDEQVRAREEQAQSNLAQAEARLLRAQQQIAVLEEQVEQSLLGTEQARLDAEGRVRQAEGQAAAAEAQLAQAEAAYRQALYDAERFASLVRTGDVSERSGKQAQSAAEAQAAVVRAARKQVEAARKIQANRL
jgi:HlyD family secretion protein